MSPQTTSNEACFPLLGLYFEYVCARARASVFVVCVWGEGLTMKSTHLSIDEADFGQEKKHVPGGGVDLERTLLWTLTLWNREHHPFYSDDRSQRPFHFPQGSNLSYINDKLRIIRKQLIIIVIMGCTTVGNATTLKPIGEAIYLHRTLQQIKPI